MSANCGSHCGEVNGEISARYRRILILVVVINASMFLVEIMFSVSAQSKALQADALDFLADAMTYGISLWALGYSLRIRSMVALIKALSLSLMAFWVASSSVYRFFVIHQPEPFTMGYVAFAALAANLLSVILLIRYRDGDSNIRSVWLCSRNDAIGNVAVIIAASGVWASQTAWPDLLVALLMAALFLNSSWQISRQALTEWQQSAHTH